MNKYIKPTFALASLSTTAMAFNNCAYRITEDDKDFFDYQYPAGWRENGFHSSEANCTIPINGLCKFTAGDNGITQAFTS